MHRKGGDNAGAVWKLGGVVSWRKQFGKNHKAFRNYEVLRKVMLKITQWVIVNINNGFNLFYRFIIKKESFTSHRSMSFMKS